MITCDFKAGIGTSSRKLPEVMGGYTVGVLVMSNFGVMRQLRVGGLPVGEVLDARYRKAVQRRTQDYGSIIAVIATDAPLATHQLNRLAKRAALGIGRVGSSAMHGSGEIILAFSTANQVPRETRKMVYRMKILLDQRLDPLYEAVIEGTEEAILNALCMARDLDGANGNICRALPLADVKDLVAQWQAESARQAALPPRILGGRGPAEGATRVRTGSAGARPSTVRGAEGMARPAVDPGRPAAPPPPDEAPRESGPGKAGDGSPQA
jgi:D-aminopeptidase